MAILFRSMIGLILVPFWWTRLVFITMIEAGRVERELGQFQRVSVEALPYRSATFDKVVNTMEFSGHPRTDLAMSEIRRVLQPGTRRVFYKWSFGIRGVRPAG